MQKTDIFLEIKEQLGNDFKREKELFDKANLSVNDCLDLVNILTLEKRF